MVELDVMAGTISNVPIHVVANDAAPNRTVRLLKRLLHMFGQIVVVCKPFDSLRGAFRRLVLHRL